MTRSGMMEQKLLSRNSVCFNASFQALNQEGIGTNYS